MKWIWRRLAWPALLGLLVLSALGAVRATTAAADPILVGAGDIADCGASSDAAHAEATARLLDGIDGTVFTAGDNAYSSGTATQFRDCYHPRWGRHLARTRPAPGNHDYETSGASGYFGYFGERAGAAGRGYYSYDLGAWHIVSLNSEIAAASSSAQALWLRADLDAHPATCTLAYWHKPLFSSGEHGNTATMRDLSTILYEHGADVVIAGHDHDYERFAPQSPSGTADPSGMREFVVGTGGAHQRSFGTIRPNSERRSTGVWGVLKLTLHPTSYDWEFVPIVGQSFSDAGSATCVGSGGSMPTATTRATTLPTASPTPHTQSSPTTRPPTPMPSATARPPTATPKPTTPLPPLPPSPTPPQQSSGIWISAAELSRLPMRGSAWNRLLAVADGDLGTANIADQNSSHDVRTLAVALIYARTGQASYRAKAADAITAAIGTEQGGRTLALARNLVSYVIAADLIDLHSYDEAKDQQFRAWLSAVRRETLSGKTLISTHEERPNNWGTHAGAARVVADMYLGDKADLARAAQVFKGWLGDRSAYAGFTYGDRSWQADPSKPVGINPKGATRDGHSIDGVLPDDQRRAGGWRWPPPHENYVWEALQGAIVQAELLHRAGYDVYAWQDQALLRAYTWLHTVCQYSAAGDDTWQTWIVNARYGTSFPAGSGTGKNMGWTDWTHAR